MNKPIKYVFVTFSCILSWLIFFLVPQNIDSHNRVENLNKIESFDISIFLQILQEPLVHFVGKLLQIFGVLSAFSMQLTLYSIIIVIAIKVMSTRFVFFPLLFIFPPIWLLLFNIQPMCISLLISYFILTTRKDFKSSTKAFRKDMVFLIVALGFHWVSFVLIPIVFIKHKKFLLITVVLLVSAVMILFLGWSLGQQLGNKIDVYKAASFNESSMIHVYLAIALAIILCGMNLAFRSNNIILRFNSMIYIYIILLVIFSLDTVGYKAASRLAFILDIWIILDLIMFWIPTKIKKGPVINFENKSYPVVPV
jgi:hypothetical protein